MSMQKVLMVPVIGQQTPNWCWAASAEMIFSYMGHDVRQCEQANKYFGREDCCNEPTPCAEGGKPILDHWQSWGFEFTRLPRALAPQEIMDEINAKKPFTFSWGWILAPGKGHQMVVAGYSSVGNLFLVVVNDPWPPPSGDQIWVPWIEYAGLLSGLAKDPQTKKAAYDPHTYRKTYYKIAKVSTGGADEAGFAIQGGADEAGGATQDGADENEVKQEMPAGAEGESYNDPESAASASLELFAVLVTPETAKQMGFDEPATDTSDLSLGHPYPKYYIRHDALAEHQEGSDVKKLLQDGNELVFPVLKAGKLVSSIIVAKRNGQWALKSLGHANLTQHLNDVRSRHSAESNKAETEYFIVHVPSMYHMFVAHYDDSGKLMLTHVHDDREHGFVKHRTDSGQDVFDKISRKAKLEQSALPMPEEPDNT